MKALLRAGSDPNFANDERYTPCHWTLSAGMLTLLVNAGGDLRRKSKLDETPFQFRKRVDHNVEHLRPIYEAWTPHRMFPRWTPSAFPLYIDQCDGFKSAIVSLLLCLRRYRHVIPKEVGMEIVEYVAEMHRKEMWWPSYEDFEMAQYM